MSVFLRFVCKVIQNKCVYFHQNTPIVIFAQQIQCLNSFMTCFTKVLLKVFLNVSL
jgi:hypothetical protein